MAAEHLELVGVNEINKGAELMLHAVAEQQRHHLRGWKVAVPQDTLSFEARARAGVRQRIRFERLGRLGLLAGDLVPGRVREPWGLVAEKEIAGVLDASGFAYSDQQRRGPFEARVRDYRRWHAQGKRIVLLPQAFGPFETTEGRRLAAQLLSSVDLAFARDDESRGWLESLDTPTEVAVAPDFTNLVHVEPTADQHERFGGRVAVVPNFRMIDRVAPDAAAAYRRLLVALLDRLGEDGFVLIVNAKKDTELIASLRSHARHVQEVVEPDDPREVKQILGVCLLTVASRFHALASSLAQGVPAVAMGWSHKYPALMTDYRTDDLLVDVADGPRLFTLLDRLTDAAERDRSAAKVASRSEALQEQSHDMWRRVARILA
jgi:polysaccharide pyruvyl transferase WcaK-like protein